MIRSGSYSWRYYGYLCIYVSGVSRVGELAVMLVEADTRQASKRRSCSRRGGGENASGRVDMSWGMQLYKKENAMETCVHKKT